MLTVKLSSLLTVLALSLLGDAATPTARQFTNGERFVRGLGPAKPRRFYDTTGPHRARRSATPVTSLHVGIFPAGALPDSSSLLGYIATGEPAVGSPVQVTTDSSQATFLTYEMPADPSGFRTIYIPNPLPSYLSACSTSSIAAAMTLSSTNRNGEAMCFASTATPANVPPSGPEEGNFAAWESTIYTVDPVTGAITARWTNPDGSVVIPTFIWVGSSLFITANPAGFRVTVGGGSIVSLFFTSL
ncbi:hypothetical protein DACRYDRAFT_21545 [Dacryopinax primogenitus]|uniref:Uncharacterized protein n=1 Tax=Dacryopinax primogenitus (strain DJM 731) TaxID=1858805 RepID=M5G545_DACPD|nr:uncharacterized protein DACRYDRAFT_21545 [Dacryopinax primogenitus]EJU03350.1 hypothetical protein DACRYDRAFT_21545 [Dacryopinax primogenitus]